MTARDRVAEHTVDGGALEHDLDLEVTRALESELGASLPHADTVPGAPARPRAAALFDDDAFRALVAFVNDQRHALRDRAWDNLAHVEAFSRALRFCVSGAAFSVPLEPERTAARPGSTPPQAVLLDSAPPASLPPATAPLLARLQDDIERRRIAELLVPLLPEAARARPFTPLPDALARRADVGFRLAAGDLPRISPVLSVHLADPALLDDVFVPGARVLAPRAACPFAARGSVLLLEVDRVEGDAVRGRALLPDGGSTDVRRATDGTPLRDVEGREQPVEVRREALAQLLLGAGLDARGLDLRFSDDRALLLAYAGLLKERGLFTALERAEHLARDARVALVRQCVHAAFDCVAQYALDPLACAITLERYDGDQGWPERAWHMLCASGGVREVHARHRGDTPGMRRTALWLDAVLPPGFAAGRLAAVASGRAFARLVTSVLAPLGVLPCSGLKDGSGAVLLQTLVPRAEGGGQGSALASIDIVRFGDAPAIVAVDGASGLGRGLALTDARAQPTHDLAALPSWMAFFLEAADPSSALLSNAEDAP